MHILFLFGLCMFVFVKPSFVIVLVEYVWSWLSFYRCSRIHFALKDAPTCSLGEFGGPYGSQFNVGSTIFHSLIIHSSFLPWLEWVIVGIALYSTIYGLRAYGSSSKIVSWQKCWLGLPWWPASIYNVGQFLVKLRVLKIYTRIILLRFYFSQTKAFIYLCFDSSFKQEAMLWSSVPDFGLPHKPLVENIMDKSARLYSFWRFILPSLLVMSAGHWYVIINQDIFGVQQDPSCAQMEIN